MGNSASENATILENIQVFNETSVSELESLTNSLPKTEQNTTNMINSIGEDEKFITNVDQYTEMEKRLIICDVCSKNQMKDSQLCVNCFFIVSGNTPKTF